MSTLTFRSTVPLCLLIWFLMCFRAHGCKEMDFKVTLEKQALVNHTFLIVKANNDAHCETKCFVDNRCISYNFGRSASGELNTCELNHADHRQFPDDLVPRPDTLYRMAETTCNCSKYEICRPNFELGTHRCECKPIYTLEKCNANYQMKNCKGFEDRRDVFEIDASDESAVKHTICRLILNTTDVDSPQFQQPYRLSVDLFTSRPDKSNVMHPGIAFNVQDPDNFDYIFFRTHKPSICVQPGYVANSVDKRNTPVSCATPPPVHTWFNVSLEVRASFAILFVNDQRAMRFSPKFSLRQRGGVATVNGYKNFNLFRNYNVASL